MRVLKEKRRRGARWPENVEIVQRFPLAGFSLCSIDIYSTDVLFFFFEFELLRAPLIGLLFSNEEQKSSAYDILDTSAGHVHDITDIHCQTQNGSSYGRVFATFKRGFLTSQTINRLRNCCEWGFLLLLLLFFLPVRPVSGI